MNKSQLRKFDLKTQQFIQKSPFGPWVQKLPAKTFSTSIAVISLVILELAVFQTRKADTSLQPIAQQGPITSPIPRSKSFGDINADSKIDSIDLTIMINSWGNLGGPADLNQDGIVNSKDLSILLEHWTK